MIHESFVTSVQVDGSPWRRDRCAVHRAVALTPRPCFSPAGRFTDRPPCSTPGGRCDELPHPELPSPLKRSQRKARLNILNGGQRVGLLH